MSTTTGTEAISNLVSQVLAAISPDGVEYGVTGKTMALIPWGYGYAQATFDVLGVYHAQVQVDSRAALKNAIDLLRASTDRLDSDDSVLHADLQALDAAIQTLATPIDAQSSGMAHLSAQADAQALVLGSLLAQQQSNGQTQAAILASNLRQESLLAAIAANTGAIDVDAKAAAAQAHQDATAELTSIQATNAGIQAAHADAAAQLATTQAAQSQAHADAQAQTSAQNAATSAIGAASTQAHSDAGTINATEAAQTTAIGSAATQAHADAQAMAAALALIHSDDQATATALATLHTDDQGLQTSLTALIAAMGAENATLSAISLTDTGVLNALKAMQTGGVPFAASSTTAATTTLFQAGANGSDLLSLALVCPNLLSGILSGLASVTIFYAASATATSGTNLDAVSLAGGASLALNPSANVPANNYVRMTNAVGAATAFGARKDL